MGALKIPRMENRPVIVNIIDKRSRQRRWKTVMAIVEPAWHDNKLPDSDQVELESRDFSYDERKGVSVSHAIEWAQSLPYSVTLYISDFRLSEPKVPLIISGSGQRK